MDALHEWWYFNSHLKTKTGRRYGLFIAVFPHLMFVALADKSEKRVVKRQIIKAPVKASTTCLNLEVGNNWWRQVSGRPFNYAICLNEDYTGLRLELAPRKHPVYVNQNGYIREGLLGYSRYYALTNMRVSGTLRLNEKRFDVRGIGWIDRQWGSWDFGGIGGWNWFSLQLSNNVEILVAQCFHPLTGNLSMKLLNIIDGEGRTKVYDKFTVECLKEWRSQRTGSVYGTRWTISMPLNTSIVVSPVFDEQEIYRGLWEGCCEVSGQLQGQRVNGVGYAEQSSFGYASDLFRLISLGTAPIHYIGQIILKRADFKVSKLLQFERLDRLLRKKAKPCRGSLESGFVTAMQRPT